MKKVMIFVVLATALTGCLQSQPEPASVPVSVVEPETVKLTKLVTLFDISAMFDWLNGYRTANKDSEAGE